MALEYTPFMKMIEVQQKALELVLWSSKLFDLLKENKSIFI